MDIKLKAGYADGHLTGFWHSPPKAYELSTVASSSNMMGISSFTGYTRRHCLHFRLSGFSRYSSGCLHAGHTRISSKSAGIMNSIVRHELNLDFAFELRRKREKKQAPQFPCRPWRCKIL